MNGDQLTVGRAKIFSNVYKAGIEPNVKQLSNQYWDYLNQVKPNQYDMEYYKYDVSSVGEAAVKKVKIYGPYSYLQAQQLLRKEMRSTRSKDWLVLKIEGFGFLPEKYESIE